MEGEIAKGVREVGVEEREGEKGEGQKVGEGDGERVLGGAGGVVLGLEAESGEGEGECADEKVG